jgi:colanic acid/amylovoran biosynthesis glycosyltransferase
MRDGGGQAVASIAYIMSSFPTVTETFILREMIELERLGAEVIIFPLLRGRPTVRHVGVEQLLPKVFYTPFLSVTIIRANFHFMCRGPRRYLKTLFTVLRGSCGSMRTFLRAVAVFPKSVYYARLCNQISVRHIHAHFATHPTLAALIISKLTGISFSFTAHAYDIFMDQQMLEEKIQSAQFVITISDYNKRLLLHRYAKVANDKIKVIRCGIESETYSEARRRLAMNRMDDEGLGLEPFTVLCVAGLHPYKGLKYLVKACHLLREQIGIFRCQIIGEGPDQLELQELIAKLELQGRVELLGAKPAEEVTSRLVRADLFVMPSILAPSGEMDGIPVALMEAMASNLPVVATRISGIPELVDDGINGLLVPPADERALADAIAKLYRNDRLRKRLGERARGKVVAEFELHDNVAKLYALIREAVGGQGVESILTNDSAEPCSPALADGSAAADFAPSTPLDGDSTTLGGRFAS